MHLVRLAHFMLHFQHLGIWFEYLSTSLANQHFELSLSRLGKPKILLIIYFIETFIVKNIINLEFFYVEFYCH